MANCVDDISWQNELGVILSPLLPYFPLPRFTFRVILQERRDSTDELLTFVVLFVYRITGQ
jgi:hypothetical protein